jgi:hypothetical protein
MAPTQHSRFYKQRFPEVEDVVMVNVKSIQGLDFHHLCMVSALYSRAIV